MRLQFGDFLFDTDSRELRDGSTEKHLSPKAFALLRFLIERRPQAVSKTELHEHLWPATFVSDATVTSLVAEVRAALGETRRGGFVRTVHGYGYAFNGTVTAVAGPTRSLQTERRCWIVWEWGQLALTDGDHVLGRDDDVAVWLESPTVSRHHARIRIVGSDATIEDLGSKNGTYLRGKRLVTTAHLEDGDEVHIGSVKLRFRRVAPGTSTETLEVR
jgi:DNA-binding winged helix-turn-helix (wHTH) protein